MYFWALVGRFLLSLIPPLGNSDPSGIQIQDRVELYKGHT